ncbi:MAG TPA: response regulator [Terriglobia bacterium]|nr:response regulator [Terriglobia bacterium]
MSATKVLVVDDDAESRELLSEVLGSNGYTVASVGDGAAAREALDRDDGYAIVIADLRMPNGTGLDLLQYLRERKSKQEIILMSSFMSGAERKMALDLGARALLEKPFRLSQLLQVVGDLAAKSALGVAP